MIRQKPHGLESATANPPLYKALTLFQLLCKPDPSEQFDKTRVSADEIIRRVDAHGHERPYTGAALVRAL